MRKTKKYLIKVINRETILYIVFGIATTLINFSVFAVLNKAFLLPWKESNIAAWIVAVIFAFFTNKYYVFSSKSTEKKKLIWEFSTFISARLLSLLVEYIGLFIMIDMCHIEELISKVVINVIVIIVNYIFSKFITFRKK